MKERCVDFTLLEATWGCRGCRSGTGGIVAASAVAADHDSRLDDELMIAIGGFQYFDSEAGTEYTGLLFFGIVLAIAGLLALCAFVTIRAAAR